MLPVAANADAQASANRRDIFMIIPDPALAVYCVVGGLYQRLRMHASLSKQWSCLKVKFQVPWRSRNGRHQMNSVHVVFEPAT
jgi:hypothetical protein